MVINHQMLVPKSSRFVKPACFLASEKARVICLFSNFAANLRTFWRNLYGPQEDPTNYGILPFWMGGHGVSLQTRENMDMIENIKQQMQAEVSFETEDLKHSIYYSKHNIYDSKYSICQPDD